MASHGGIFRNYLQKDVTHIICSNLPDSKVKHLENVKERCPPAQCLLSLSILAMIQDRMILFILQGSETNRPSRMGDRFLRSWPAAAGETSLPHSQTGRHSAFKVCYMSTLPQVIKQCAPCRWKITRFGGCVTDQAKSP